MNVAEIIPLDERKRRISELIRSEKTQQQVQSALPSIGVTRERFTRWVFTALGRSKDLLMCDPPSIIGAMIQSAQLGLDPSGVTGEAYLVAYKDKCTLIPGYRGLMQLAWRSGVITEINAGVVREGDTFEYELGLDSRLKHKKGEGERGAMTHAYAYAKTKDGGRIFVVLTAQEVGLVRARSPSRDKGPWVTDTEAMWSKTAVRRLGKFLPMKTEDYRAFEIAEKEESGTPEIFEVADVEVMDEPPAEGVKS